MNQGYVTLTGGLEQFLRKRATVVYRAYDKSAIGPLLVYRLPWADAAAKEVTR